ncbi:MAG: RIP metalloprotease RseP [Deltaproteobacteria bacterium]|nr:RIP metalloprotease RseP [Deltaproteobacteria bacterium]
MASTLWALVFFIILIGVLVLVHEGGHFLFAKLFKVKVHVFSMGFGPKLAAVRRGETEYRLSAIPVGGYVKMLGEDPSEELGPEDRGRAFGDKPRWQRLVIILGGPCMNLIFPLFLHFGAGLTMTKVVPPEVGTVLPGSPAFEAGLRPGDRVESVGGKRIGSFDDLIAAVAPRPGVPLRFEVRRGKTLFTRTITPAPLEERVLLDVKERVGRIGIGPSYLAAQVGVEDPGSPAGKAGLRTFDVVVSANGRPLTRYVELEKVLVAAAGHSVGLVVRRLAPDAKPPLETALEKGKRSLILVVPADAHSLADLGIGPSADFVAYVAPGGAADKIGLARGDRLESLDGRTYPMGQVFDAIEREPERTWRLSFSREGQSFERSYKPAFHPAGEAGKLGPAPGVYDKGFWGMAAAVAPVPVPNPALVRSALSFAATETANGFKVMFLGFKLLFQGKVSVRTLGGPIMIGQLAGRAGEAGALSFLWIMALISVNLGLINLFPIPVLDGGQILLIGVESLLRKPLSRLLKERIMLVGVAMILALLVFATWNDIARLFVGG